MLRDTDAMEVIILENQHANFEFSRKEGKLQNFDVDMMCLLVEPSTTDQL